MNDIGDPVPAVLGRPNISILYASGYPQLKLDRDAGEPSKLTVTVHV